MATVDEVEVTGRKYRIWDAVNSIWKRISFWTKASDVEFDDGTNLEDKIEELNSSFSDALASLKATAIAQAISVSGTTFTEVIEELGEIIDYSDGTDADATLTSSDTRPVYNVDLATGGDSRVWGVTNSDSTKRLCIGVPNDGYYSTSDTLGTPMTNLGTATAAQVLYGKTFSSSAGLKITGTMTNRGAYTTTVTSNGSVTIPAGYHNGSGYVKVNVSAKTVLTNSWTKLNSSVARWPSGNEISHTATTAGLYLAMANAFAAADPVPAPPASCSTTGTILTYISTAGDTYYVGQTDCVMIAWLEVGQTISATANGSANNSTNQAMTSLWQHN